MAQLTCGLLSRRRVIEIYLRLRPNASFSGAETAAGAFGGNPIGADELAEARALALSCASLATPLVLARTSGDGAALALSDGVGSAAGRRGASPGTAETVVGSVAR